MSKCQRVLPSNVLEAHYKLLELRCRFRLNFTKLFGYPEEHDIFFCLTENIFWKGIHSHVTGNFICICKKLP